MHLPLEFIAINICMHFFQYNLALYTIYDNRYTVYGIRSIYIYESILYICVYVRTIFANKQKHETITRQDIQVQVTKHLENSTSSRESRGKYYTSFLGQFLNRPTVQTALII